MLCADSVSRPSICVYSSLYCDLSFFVADAWGKSAVLRQEQGLRQGDPLACFLLLILMTVIMLDCRDAFFAECARQNIGQIHSYPERVFGFQDVGFADDTNLIHVHLPSLRILVKCFLKEAAYYGFFANNAPQPDGKSFLLAFNPDVAIIRVKDLDGRDFPLVPEAKTLGIVYGQAFQTAANVYRARISSMQGSMNQYKFVWRSNVPLKNKVNKMNALVWNKGRWSLHLFPLLPALRRSIDGSQARFLRRILKIPAAYISRISHATVRRRCSTFRFSTFIFRSQLRWLGHILRKPATHPLRRVLFDDRPDLPPRRPPSLHSFHPQRAVRGRPNVDWGQDLLHKIYRLSGLSRRDVGIIAQDRRRFHLLVERLCSLADQS